MGNHFLEASTTFQLHHLFLQQGELNSKMPRMLSARRSSRSLRRLAHALRSALLQLPLGTLSVNAPRWRLHVGP
jgi:hypothetical protein